MQKKIVLIHPFDPWGKKVGGIETFLKGFMIYAPKEFEIELIGTTSSISQRPYGTWQSINLGPNYR